MALSMNSVGIPGGFRGNAGFSGKLGVWGGFGRFGGSKGFCANSQFLEVPLCIFPRGSLNCHVTAWLLPFDGPAIRNANRGDSYESIHANPFAEKDIPKGPKIENKFKIVTLPTLQKHFVNIFFVFAWEFCIEKWRGFLVNFFWSPFPTKRSTKNPRKIRGKFGAKFGAKSGTKIWKIRGTFVLQLFWPKRSPSGIEIFNRDWKFQASHPAKPIFCGEFWRSGLKFSIEIEIFNRDWNFQSGLIFFQSLGP